MQRDAAAGSLAGAIRFRVPSWGSPAPRGIGAGLRAVRRNRFSGLGKRRFRHFNTAVRRKVRADWRSRRQVITEPMGLSAAESRSTGRIAIDGACSGGGFRTGKNLICPHSRHLR